MKFPNLSQNKQSTFNIIGCIIVVIVNTLINFILSPFIVETLGVEANGYISLANNFVSYFGLITTALNSMTGRFMLIELRRGDIKSANEYYTSVCYADWLLAMILVIPVTILLAFVDKAIDIEPGMVSDVRFLFALVFLNFFLPLILPKWANAAYVTNNLYLRSVKSVISAVCRAIVLYLLFLFFKPAVYFVAIAGMVMVVLDLLCDFICKKTLIPEIHIKRKYFNIKKVGILLSSGIWNAISQCGAILLDGLDLLISNIFINGTVAGVFTLSKFVPHMVNQVTGTIATTFGPKLTYAYADNNIDGIVKGVKADIKIMMLLANIPIGVALVFGKSFFRLWVPSQNSTELTLLAAFALIGMMAISVSYCLTNIFGVVNKLKLNSVVMIASGLLNTGLVFLLLNVTSLGVYAIALVAATTAIIRLLVFTAPYAAKCIGKPLHTFFGQIFKSFLNILIPIGVSIVVFLLIPSNTWLTFILCIFVSCIIILVLDYFLALNKNEKVLVKELFHRIFKKQR